MNEEKEPLSPHTSRRRQIIPLTSTDEEGGEEGGEEGWWRPSDEEVERVNLLGKRMAATISREGREG